MGNGLCLFKSPLVTPIICQLADHIQVSILYTSTSAELNHVHQQHLYSRRSGSRRSLLDTGQSIGLAVDAEAGLISLTALLGAFILIFVSYDSCDNVESVNCFPVQIKAYRRRTLVQRPMDLFVVGLQVIGASSRSINVNGNSLCYSYSILLCR
jgi:hypothetical protein